VVVDKARDLTSFDVVARARKHFGTRRVGHAGTLDPMATGVLLVLLGEATKLADVLSGAYKTYDAEITLGRSTDTLDATGRTTAEVASPGAVGAGLQLALDRELQRKRQQPPQHSALKVGGRRAYELARAGQQVPLAERAVHVRELALLHQEPATIRVRLCVSKGYYVRSFARDVCESLGVPGHLSALRRIESGGFRIEEATEWPPPAAFEPLPVAAAARRALPVAVLTAEGAVRAGHGKTLSPEHFDTPPEGDEPCGWFDPTGALVAVGVRAEDGLKVRRGFQPDRTR
jgi:tRNA pseudouridine55 synthase